jgi:AcrR family transcriptional regulator
VTENPSLHQQMIAAAIELTTTSGWSSVTMSRIAGVVGVSRQTVYNEVGSKPELAQAMVLDELARFLAVVESAFDRHPDDLSRSMTAAVRGVLQLADGNDLLRAIVSGTHGEDVDLLPPLTTRAESVLAAARTVLADRLASYDVPLTAPELTSASDAVVRLVLSHVVQPTGPTARTASDLATVALRILGAAPVRPVPDVARPRRVT